MNMKGWAVTMGLGAAAAVSGAVAVLTGKKAKKG